MTRETNANETAPSDRPAGRSAEARLFVAIGVEESARQALEQLSANLQKGFQFTPCRPAWTRPEAMHLTLAFLGKIPRERIVPITASLQRAATNFAPLRIEIKGLGVFPNWRRPGILWCGLRDRTHQLAPLHEAVERALAPFGYEPEVRDFHPHLTLARFKSQRGVAAAEKIVMAHKNYSIGSYQAASILLFESELHAEAARHFLINSFDLSNEKDK